MDWWIWNGRQKQSKARSLSGPVDDPKKLPKWNYDSSSTGPCESISLFTLLSSLIRLGSSICKYKSSTFFVNQKNARNSIGLIENILLVLEQIIPSPENGSSDIVKPIACSLSELPFIFQKVQFLLEDITRKDYSRLRAKAEFVSSQFRLLMKAMWVALDVLPLEKMDICEEVKELAEFVKIQAMKMDFGIEVTDQRTMSEVYSIFDQFEVGVINPEPNDLNNILDYLGIRVWKDCNKEVKFLESEVGLELQTSGMRDFQLLCSLIAFLIFCRCTLFESVDRQDGEEQKQRQKQSYDVFHKFLKSDDDFRCPITQEIMCDPVTISTGHTMIGFLS